ncbi:MAG: RNA polymerase sigma factor [Candidatus Poribacteria bacterium]|nr:RNA polymerase sigma factor [Candidatus Poribacteria bacterium]
MRFIELTRRAQEGDSEAFGELVRQFQGMAFGYAYSLLGDFHLAQDAAQDAFIQAYHDIRMVTTPAAFPSWLKRVVFKHCDRIRRRRQLLLADAETLNAVADHTPNVAEEIVEDETRRQALAALSSLNEDERAVTLLVYVHGYRQREVAAFLEITVDAVKNRLRSARRKLAERMLMLTNRRFTTTRPISPSDTKT